MSTSLIFISIFCSKLSGTCEAFNIKLLKKITTLTPFQNLNMHPPHRKLYWKKWIHEKCLPYLPIFVINNVSCLIDDIQKLQLDFAQYGFELLGSIYMWIFVQWLLLMYFPFFMPEIFFPSIFWSLGPLVVNSFSSSMSEKFLIFSFVFKWYFEWLQNSWLTFVVFFQYLKDLVPLSSVYVVLARN